MKMSSIVAAIIQSAVKLKASPDPFQSCWVIPFNETPWPIALVFDPDTLKGVIINTRTKKAINLNGSPASDHMKAGVMDKLVADNGVNVWLKQEPFLAKKLKDATEITESLINEVVSSIQSLLEHPYVVAKGRISVPAKFLNETAKPKKNPVADDPDLPEPAINGYFVLGYWSNPYGRGTDREYFWSGPFLHRANATAFGKKRQQNGQPKRFIDWVVGRNSIIQGWSKFKVAANKVGINPSDNEIGCYNDM